MMNHPLPEAFIARMRAQLGAEADAYFAALELAYQRGIRLNPRKPLAQSPDGAGEPVPWNAALGRYLAQNSTLGLDPLHEAGACYIQEPSAMAPVALLSPIPGERAQRTDPAPVRRAGDPEAPPGPWPRAPAGSRRPPRGRGAGRGAWRGRSSTPPGTRARAANQNRAGVRFSGDCGAGPRCGWRRSLPGRPHIHRREAGAFSQKIRWGTLFSPRILIVLHDGAKAKKTF